jgi:ABC-2 type transport system permease protein
MLRGFRAVVAKEFRHLGRDPKGLLYILLVPFVMIFVYGYGISIDVRDVRTAVIDYDGGAAAARYIRALRASKVFTLEDYGPRSGRRAPLEEAERDLRMGRIREILIIPADFAEDLAAGRTGEVEVVIDGGDANSALLIGQIHERIAVDLSLELSPFRLELPVRVRFAFNPDGNSAPSIIPGLFAVILMVISALLTSVAIAREKETGALDLLLLSPLSARAVVLGKALPYALVAFFDGAVILVLARVWFHIPFRGDLGALALYSGLFVATGAALGILISTAVGTQRAAAIAEVLTTLLPSFFLSGFFIPVETLPVVLRGLSSLVPATYFIRIVRGILLKGSAFGDFLKEGAVLAAMSAALLGLAVANIQSRRRRPR